MNKEKLEYYAYLTVSLLGLALFGYVFIKYLFFVSLPFLISWTVAFSLRPVSKRLAGLTHIPYKVISGTLTAVIVLGGIAVLISALAFAIGEAWDFLRGLADSERLFEFLNRIMNPIGGLLGDREGAAELESHIGGALKGMISSLLTSVAEGISSFIVSVPKVLIFVLVTVVSSIYFAIDLERINGAVKRVLPKKISDALVSFKNRFLVAILKYLRSYLIIMLVMFVIMLFGFIILKVKYAVLLAFLVSLLDALPLIGIGTVLVPLSVYEIIFGNVRRGVGLIILFIIAELIRQFAEPKIVGESLGIHPALSLVILYLVYFFFGVLGLLLVPLVTVVIKILADKNNSA